MPPVNTSPLISREVLIHLIQTQAVRRIVLERQPNKTWQLVASTSAGEKILQSSRENAARCFRTTDGAISTLESLGVRFAEIDFGSRRPI